MKGFFQAYLPAAALTALALAACTAEPAPSDGDGPVRLEATARVEEPGAERVETRATENATALQNATFAANQTVKVYYLGGKVVDSAGAQVDEGTATVSGTAITFDATHYLNHGEENVTVDVYHPSTAGRSLTAWSVPADQSSDAAYRSGDLMWGTGVLTRTRVTHGTGLAAYPSATGTVTFRHRMAKLLVTVTRGSGVSRIERVSIVSGYRTVSVDQGATLKTGTALSDEVAPGAGKRIDLLTSATTAASTTVSGLMPPQELALSDAFLEVECTLENGLAGLTRYRLTAGQTLEGGHSYALSVSPASNPGTVTVGITGFTDETVSSLTYASPVILSAPNLYYVNGAVFRMVPVKGGSFSLQMHNVTGADVEATAYTVTGTLSDYFLSETEVTRGLYAAVMGGDASGQEDYPRTNISWTGWWAFIDKLNELTAGQRPEGWKFTMPSEIQWQYAAEGGVYSRHYPYSGSATLTEVSVYSGSAPVSVASKMANELGIYDMSGNVTEPCLDRYEDLTADVDRGEDYVHTTGSAYVYRGASYNWGGEVFSRVGSRNENSGTAHNNSGLRLALRKLKVGDVYYSDGSWGSPAEYHEGKTPIGIVFKVGTSADDRARGYRNGYVVALKEAATATNWCKDVPDAEGSANLRELAVTDTQSGDFGLTDNNTAACNWVYNDLDGLTHCLTAREKAWKTVGWKFSDLTAIYNAMNYDGAAAPSSSSGWYLPSVGQNYWLLRAGGESNFKGSFGFQDGSEVYYNWLDSGTDAPPLKDRLNEFLAASGAADYDPFKAQDGPMPRYWTSSEVSADTPWVTYWNGNAGCYVSYGKSSAPENSVVRSVLAF